MIENWEQRIAAVRQMVNDRFVDGYGYYPERVGKRVKLYEVELRSSSVRAALHGTGGSVIESVFDDSTDPCRTLFSAIALLVDDYPACWVQVFWHDDCFGEVRTIWIADPVYTEHFALLLDTERADEGGPSGIALFFEDGEGLILFDRRGLNQPPYNTRLLVAFYGSPERRKAVFDALKRARVPEANRG